MKGWIKLHRKILDNDGLFRSKNTFTVWCWILLMVDRKTGSFTTGRFQISRWLKIKPSTAYQTLKRLSNMTMINLKSNNKMTTITVCNWEKYQHTITTKQQQSNKKVTLNKNKEVRIKKERENTNTLFLTRNQKETLRKQFPNADIDLEILKANDYLKAEGIIKKDYLAWFRNWLRKIKLQNNIVNGKKVNPIIEDKIFLEWCKGELRNVSALDRKYPLWKFKEEWVEAHKFKASFKY